MSHFDRLIVPAYTSPETQTRTTWTYREALSAGFKKRIDSRRFVGINGTVRRDLGFDINDYPMPCVFNGIDHDQDALDFVTTLKETVTPETPGILEHPREGVQPVTVAEGSITHNPAKNASQTIIEVLFQHQTTLPGQQTQSPIIATQKQLELLNAAAVSDFSLQQSLSNAGDRLATIRETTAQLNKITETVGAVVALSGQAQATFNAIQDDILRNLDTLVKAPFTLATQMQLMVQTVLAVPGNFAEKAQAWKDLYTKSTGESNLYDTAPTTANRNRIGVQELSSVSALSANMANVVFQINDFSSKTAAFNALTDAQQQIQNMAADLDYMQDTFEIEVYQDRYFSNRESYPQFQELIRIVNLATQQVSQRLKTTFVLTLDADTTLLQLAAKYYKDVSDQTLDFIIEQNHLTIDTMILLTAGTELEI